MNDIANDHVGPMPNPPHLGEPIRESMDEAVWNVTGTAARLGCKRGTLSRLLNGEAGVPNLDNFYNPDLMPPDLRRAHQALDRAVDRLYRRSGFASERERAEYLFMLYEKMRAPLAAGMKGRRRRTTRRQTR